MSEFTEEDVHQTNANMIKQTIIRGLLSEGVISKVDAQRILKDYMIIVAKPKWWGKLWKKITKATEDLDCYHYYFMKIVDLPDEKDITDDQEH